MGRTWIPRVSKFFAPAFLLLLFLHSPGQAGEITKLSLDDASSLGTTVLTDNTVKQEGDGAIKITTLWSTTICLGQVQELNVENARIIYRAEVKSENLDGAAFLEMWCHVGGNPYFSRGMNSVVSGTMDWNTLQASFLLQPGQRAKKATLSIVINGKGTVWVDDIRLLKEPLK